MKSTPTSRRTVLSGAAAIVSTTPSAASAAYRGDDTKLIELGRQLDDVLAKWSQFVRAEDADQARLERAIFQATGIPFKDAPEPRRAVTVTGERIEQEPYWRMRNEIVRRMSASTFGPLSDEEFGNLLEEIEAQARPLVRSIAALPARTLAGLAVKARAMQYLKADIWRCPGHISAVWVDNAEARLWDDICAAAGVRSLSAETGTLLDSTEV